MRCNVINVSRLCSQIRLYDFTNRVSVLNTVGTKHKQENAYWKRNQLTYTVENSQENQVNILSFRVGISLAIMIIKHLNFIFMFIYELKRMK